MDVFVDGEEVLILRKSGRGDESEDEDERGFGREMMRWGFHAASLVHGRFWGEGDFFVSEETGDNGEALDESSGEVAGKHRDGGGVGDEGARAAAEVGLDHY